MIMERRRSPSLKTTPTFRQYLSELIANTPGHRCVCACASAEDALEKIPAQRPDVVLMDIHLPGDSGIACTARLREKMPKIQVIMLTVYKDIQMIFQALKAGACGYVLKRADEKEILDAIAEVRAGGAPMTSQVARMVVRSFLEEPSDQSGNGAAFSPRNGDPGPRCARARKQGSRKSIAHQFRDGADPPVAYLREAARSLPDRGGGEILFIPTLRSARYGRPCIMTADQIALYKDPKKPDHIRVKDLLSRMTLEEKAAQMMCVWQEKAAKLVDAQGHFDFNKARAAFKEGSGMGQVGRPSDAGSKAATPADGRDARQMAELTNAIQKFFLEHTRLGIPVFFHEECLHGHAAKDANEFPAAHRSWRDVQSRPG